jgi:hypothetical protein
MKALSLSLSLFLATPTPSLPSGCPGLRALAPTSRRCSRLDRQLLSSLSALRSELCKSRGQKTESLSRTMWTRRVLCMWHVACGIWYVAMARSSDDRLALFEAYAPANSTTERHSAIRVLFQVLLILSHLHPPPPTSTHPPTRPSPASRPPSLSLSLSRYASARAFLAESIGVALVENGPDNGWTPIPTPGTLLKPDLDKNLIMMSDPFYAILSTIHYPLSTIIDISSAVVGLLFSSSCYESSGITGGRPRV